MHGQELYFRKSNLSRHGFTIVELLIVIVVIAILAAITIVAYNGITNRTIESSMKADIRGAATTVELDNTQNGSYPADAGSANGGKGLKASGNNSLAYVPKSYGFCVAVSNPSATTTLRLRSNGGQIETGDCATIAGLTWTLQATSVPDFWRSVAYGNGRFVAVAQTGTNRIMTSTDGLTWTTIVAPQQNSWQSVTYGNGRFVAVATSGTNRIMTSTDGLTWSVVPSSSLSGVSVTYGNGRFVVVAAGTSMTSTDGVTWSSVSPIGNWRAVVYGGGKFVAVADGGTNRIMTSTDGINWTAQAGPAANEWYSVAYGNGRFVAVAYYGTNRIMTSTDGTNWTAQAGPGDNDWSSVTYGDGRFVAVSWIDSTAVSTDGITWTTTTAPVQNWQSVVYGNGCFIAVTNNTPNQVMRSCE